MAICASAAWKTKTFCLWSHGKRGIRNLLSKWKVWGRFSANIGSFPLSSIGLQATWAGLYLGNILIFYLLLGSLRLLTMFEFNLCVSMQFVHEPFTWLLCPVLCHLHGVMLWNIQSAGVWGFLTDVLHCIILVLQGLQWLLSIFKKYFEVERSCMAWKGSLSGQKCLHILGDVQLHKGTTTRDFRRVALDTRMPAQPSTSAGVVKAERRKRRRTYGEAYLFLDKLVELKAHELCPLSCHQWGLWGENIDIERDSFHPGCCYDKLFSCGIIVEHNSSAVKIYCWSSVSDFQY